MQKLILFFLLIFTSSITLSAQKINDLNLPINSNNRFDIKSVELATSPWTSGVGYMYNMSVFAQVNLNGVLLKPAGLVLAAFKDGECHGLATISNSPATGGKGFVLTVGSNKTPETGYTYKVYDSSTNLIYDILETLTFQSNGKEGVINAPYQLHIIGVSALKETYESLFNVYPSIVEHNFSIVIGNKSSKNTVINLFNASGKLIKVIYNGETYNNQIIDSSLDVNSAKGVYIIKASFGSISSLKKIIIK